MFSSLHEIYCLPNRRIKTWMAYWLRIHLVTHCCHSLHQFFYKLYDIRKVGCDRLRLL